MPKFVFEKTFEAGPIKLAPEPSVLKKFEVAQLVNQTALAKVPGAQ